MGKYRVPLAMPEAEYSQLEQAVFNGKGAALEGLKQWADSNLLPPIPALIAVAQQAASSLPGGCFLDMGLGATPLNLFVAYVGNPGQGKDRLIKLVSNDLRVSNYGERLNPQHLPIGSGEGLVTALKPNDEGISTPTLFGCTEVRNLAALNKRDGSTLQGNLNAMYSGNAFGATNKTETHSVEANSYTAGLWVNVQPDYAGAILDGADDGFKHRFMWVELVNPALNLNSINNATEGHLLAIDVPPEVETTGFTFPARVVAQTRLVMAKAQKYGAESGGKGHRNLTRGRLAAGLALIRSSANVSEADWETAGLLMEYSDKVQTMCSRHLKARELSNGVAKELDQDKQAAATHKERLRNAAKKIGDAITSGRGEVRKASIRNQCRRFRGEFDELLTACLDGGVLVINDGVIMKGEQWHAGCLDPIVHTLVS